MKIYLNSEEMTIHNDSLSELLKEKALIDKKGIALAINDSIIPKALWPSFKLAEEDKVLIITATQGG